MSDSTANPVLSQSNTPQRETNRETLSQAPTAQRPGASIMASDDPSTAALRTWAEDKEKTYPGQDGSITVNPASMDAMAWGGPWTLPYKGDTLPPPDKRVAHGKATYVGPAEEEKRVVGKADREGGKRKHRVSGLFRREKKGGGKDGKGDEDDVIR